MKTVGHQLLRINDLKRQCEIAVHRYYTRESQAILVELINKELGELSNKKRISEDMFLSLLDVNRLITNDIESLCNLYKNVSLFLANFKQSRLSSDMHQYREE